MRDNLHRFIDLKTDEPDLTEMVEIWDIEESNGEATLDNDHPAWTIAFEVSEEYENKKREEKKKR